MVLRQTHSGFPTPWTLRSWQAVHRTSPADRARRDAAAEERSAHLHAVGMMPRAFHLLRAMFATGPRVQPLEEVQSLLKRPVWYPSTHHPPLTLARTLALLISVPRAAAQSHRARHSQYCRSGGV